VTLTSKSSQFIIVPIAQLHRSYKFGEMSTSS